MAECPLTALTQLRLLVPIPVFDLQFILSHLPPSVLLLCIPNVFSFSSIPFSSLILPPSFHPPPQYEPYLNNVEAPHLIKCLVGQSTRALIKNKQKNNNGGRCYTKMGRKTTCVSVHIHVGAVHMK